MLWIKISIHNHVQAKRIALDAYNWLITKGTEGHLGVLKRSTKFSFQLFMSF